MPLASISNAEGLDEALAFDDFRNKHLNELELLNNTRSLIINKETGVVEGALATHGVGVS